ncbi:MAG: glycosyltransferase [Eubacteriales bacterium]
MTRSPKKILMATMSMGIGGAETHILELSRQLAADGYEVVVVSNGGVYTGPLEDAGVRHITAPLHDKKFMLSGYKALKRAIADFRPDIVHAHARIPALLCSIICKRRKIPLLVSTHFNFVTTPILKALSRWGDRSIVVSEDLKKYLIKEYNIPPSRISVTVNGINTSVFSPESSDEGLRAELGIGEQEKVILSLSRLDEEAGHTAELLCELAGELYAKRPDTRIVIVGDGSIRKRLEEKARTVNSRTKKDYILFTGGRTDTRRFYALCDVFTGISRSALEAMASGVPTVLAGGYGWLRPLFKRKGHRVRGDQPHLPRLPPACGHK